MDGKRILASVAAVLAISASSSTGAAQMAPDRARHEPVIETGDVDRFYALYDSAAGRPTADQLQAYLDEGSAGLTHLAKVRRVTGARMADAMAARPEIYVEARACADHLPRVRARVAEGLARFIDQNPEAQFPSATFVIGRGRPVAVGSPVDGIQVGLEALCATDFINPDIEDRFVGVLIHEYVHTQQAPELTEKEQFTVLEVSMAEGVAEFVTELMIGAPAYAYLAPQTRGRELEIETAFVADQDKTDLSAWVYNSTPEKPGDLGYWVGYRIAKAYYRNAPDKHEALRQILQITDVKAFMAASGWRPGMDLS
ncbi:DUF2268 domain-containing putative Zn-dependent protease [Brevundimonas sp. NPDC055814]